MKYFLCFLLLLLCLWDCFWGYKVWTVLPDQNLFHAWKVGIGWETEEK